MKNFIFVGGDDYTSVSSTLVFTRAISSEQVTISTNPDQLLEPTESFSIHLTHGLEDANVLLLPTQSAISILDNNSELP